MTPFRYTPEQEARVCQMKQDGKTRKEMMSEMKFSSSMIQRILSRNGMIDEVRGGHNKGKKYKKNHRPDRSVCDKRSCADCGGELEGNWKFCPACIGERRKGIIPEYEIREMFGTAPINGYVESIWSRFVQICGTEKRSFG